MTTAVLSPTAPAPALETVACYCCGQRSSTAFLTAQDDLTGKPGKFSFVTCVTCGLVYQNPRIPIEHIPDYYDDEYIAHRKKTDWGILTGFYQRAMAKHDRAKDRLVSRYAVLNADSEVLDVGCGAGTFLLRLRERYGVRATGIDFKDLSDRPGFDQLEFHCGLFYEQDLAPERFDLVTMWHFLEHDYDPLRSLRTAGAVLKPEGRLVIEVPRLDSLTFRLFGDRWPGLQAPQHTALYSKALLLKLLAKAGLEVIAYLPYGAFPAYFYLFAGVAFKLRRGKGLNLARAIYPYFVGQLALGPVLLFERHLNLAMQTVVCRRRT
jgi:SAM-dependent methyltransferase